MKIAVLGTGNLGKSIAKGLITNNAITSLYLTKRNVDALKKDFEGYKNVTLTTNNIEAVKNSDILIFAVQPAHIEGLLEGIKPHLTDKHILISTIAGYEIPKIEAVVGENYSVLRAMPNTAISVGNSMTCICSNEAGSKNVKITKEIFDRLGHTIVIPETQMQAATVICASGIAFWLRLIRASTQAAVQLGFEAKEAQELAMYTSEGAASLLIQGGNHPEEEIDRVTTPKGCTIEGLNEMERAGMSTALVQGMVASFNKISNIKKEQI